MAGGGAGAEIFHFRIGTVIDARLELKTGAIAGIGGHTVMIDLLFRQLLQRETTETVIADAADPTDL